MRINAIYTVLLVLVFANAGFGQRFSASAVAGLNASQVGGDALAGFDKIGFVGGIKGTAVLVDKIDLHVDFLYSMRGSKPGVFSNNVDPDIAINLNYLDLPVYVSYNDWFEPEGEYYRAYGYAGFSYGRLISSSVTDNFNAPDQNLNNLQESFNENDFSWLVGFGFRITRNIGVSLRYTRSITLLLDPDEENAEAVPLRPYFISLRGEYTF